MPLGESMDAVMHETWRCTPWILVQAKNPTIEVRWFRPKSHRPSECKRWDPIKNPDNYEFEGACRNFNYLSIYCVFCNACPMSNIAKEIPFDVRRECDRVMGW